MPVSRAGARNRRVRIERPVANTSLKGAGSGTWQLVKEVWADVLDTLPSTSSERLAAGINVNARPARIRIAHRTDVDSTMRFVQLRGGVPIRTMQIVAGPAFKRDTNEDEFMVEDYKPAGGGA